MVVNRGLFGLAGDVGGSVGRCMGSVGVILGQ